MLDLIYFSLSSYGLTQILVYGKIFDKVRPKDGWFGQLLSCTMCTGFWVGLFLWSINAYTTLFSFDYNCTTGFLLGVISSGTAYALNSIFGDQGINIFQS